MRQEIYGELAQFRVSPTLLSEARRQARRSGMSLSEYLRAAVRDKLREAA